MLLQTHPIATQIIAAYFSYGAKKTKRPKRGALLTSVGNLDAQQTFVHSCRGEETFADESATHLAAQAVDKLERQVPNRRLSEKKKQKKKTKSLIWRARTLSNIILIGHGEVHCREERLGMLPSLDLQRNPSGPRASFHGLDPLRHQKKLSVGIFFGESLYILTWAGVRGWPLGGLVHRRQDPSSGRVQRFRHAQNRRHAEVPDSHRQTQFASSAEKRTLAETARGSVTEFAGNAYSNQSITDGGTKFYRIFSSAVVKGEVSQTDFQPSPSSPSELKSFRTPLDVGVKNIAQIFHVRQVPGLKT
ncbi:hypothetical protein B0H12DRAFT_1224858, partial [Mycena haematopus]